MRGVGEYLAHTFAETDEIRMGERIVDSDAIRHICPGLEPTELLLLLLLAKQPYSKIAASLGPGTPKRFT